MKLKVSRPSQKKNFFPLQFDNTTTLGFGFVQPLSCTELVPQSSVDLSCASFVRLAPLSTPTYGRCNLHHYTCFVPISEVYHAFDSFLSSTSYNGGGTSYVPSSVPSAECRLLTLITLFFSSCNCYMKEADGSFKRLKPTDSDDVLELLTSLIKGFGYGESFASAFYTLLGAIHPLRYSYFTSEPGDDFSTLVDKFDYTVASTTKAGAYLIFCWRFSDFTRNLRQILIGLGYQLNGSSVTVSILPLFAYYRAYYDLFFPKRFVSYEDSSLHRLIEAIEVNNKSLLWFIETSKTGSSGDFPYSHLVSDFFKDLAQCYYTSESDYVSLQHSGVSTNPVLQSVPTIRPNGGIEDVSAELHEQAALPSGVEAKNIGSVQLRVLRWLTKYINKRTYLGSKIDEILRSQYDSSTSCADSFLIDSFVTPIEISDVMNQAETSEGKLGEFAGKGIGFSSPRSAKYRSNEFGFLIHFACIVPQSGYAQAVDPCLSHVNKFDYYTPGLDGLTLVPTRKLFVFGTVDHVSAAVRDKCNDSFGNIPIYSEYKTKYSILNGDISQASTRASYLPYSLDKLIPYVNPASEDSEVNNLFSQIVNGTSWRYVGRYRWLGMYNRIFVNSGSLETSLPNIDYIRYSGSNRVDDNFIVHNHFKLSLHAPMLSFGSSFDTGADDLASESQISSSGE